MTVTVDAAHSPAPAEEPAEPPTRDPQRRLLRWVVLGVVGALSIAGGAWWITAQSALSQVSVAYDLQPVVCDGAEVGQRADGPESEFYNPVVVWTPGMECRLRIHVLNNSWSEITIDSVTLAMMGEDNLQGLEPRAVNPNGFTSTSEQYGDITFTMTGPLHIGPGDDQLLEAVIDYRGGAQYRHCDALGLHTPDVSVSAIGVTETKTPPAWSTIWFQQGSLKDCASS
ncbi:hypothetical protein [Microbacterium pumilum]